MSSRRGLLLVAGAILALVCSTSNVPLSSAEASPASFVPPPPIPHGDDTIAFFAGEWHIRAVLFDASTNAETKGFGTSTASFSASTDTVTEKSSIKFENGGEDSGTSDLTYSKKDGAFRLHSTSSGHPGAIDVDAVASRSARELQFSLSLPQTNNSMRQVVTITSPTSYTVTLYANGKDGKERMASTYKYSRVIP